MTEPRPPAHLSAAAKRWWRDTVHQFTLEPHHRMLLEAAATAWDRATDARVMIEAEGAVVRDRFGQPKPHPAVQIESTALALFARLTVQLGLDLETPAQPAHAPSRWR